MNNASIVRPQELLKYFVIYVAAQVLILNGIDYMHMFTPFLFIKFILSLPSSMSRIGQMLWAFAIGLVVDIFSNTTGLHAASCVMIAYMRPGVCTFFGSNDSANQEPTAKNFGTIRYMQYAAVLVLVHHFMFYALENSSLHNLDKVVGRTLCSALMTLLLVWCVEYFNMKRNK